MNGNLRKKCYSDCVDNNYHLPNGGLAKCGEKKKVKKLLLLLALFVWTDSKIADAIYMAEGGKKARVPYGILSVKVKDEADARRICLNTIKNNRKRYKEYGYKTHDNYLDFLADRYCPPSVDPIGNRNWKKNVRYFLNKSKKEEKWEKQRMLTSPKECFTDD